MCEMCQVRSLSTQFSNAFVRISFPKDVGGGFLTLRVDEQADVISIKEKALLTRYRKKNLSSINMKPENYILMDDKQSVLPNRTIPKKGYDVAEPTHFQMLHTTEYRRLRSVTFDYNSKRHSQESILYNDLNLVRASSMKFLVGDRVDVKRSCGMWIEAEIIGIDMEVLILPSPVQQQQLYNG
eukprot:TRINITY_DN8264_c0_g1_i1.p1 TRINITY_DN8264_c0_g1~~TRINITY_DN8264_c0_g1_i1.p1  ORF type:complete len:183 (+),score=15.65 TRINITY_DN8264_c0_g1_i1:470-1018(+)